MRRRREFCRNEILTDLLLIWSASNYHFSNVPECYRLFQQTFEANQFLNYHVQFRTSLSSCYGLNSSWKHDNDQQRAFHLRLVADLCRTTRLLGHLDSRAYPFPHSLSTRQHRLSGNVFVPGHWLQFSSRLLLLSNRSKQDVDPRPFDHSSVHTYSCNK